MLWHEGRDFVLVTHDHEGYIEEFRNGHFGSARPGLPDTLVLAGVRYPDMCEKFKWATEVWRTVRPVKLIRVEPES